MFSKCEEPHITLIHKLFLLCFQELKISWSHYLGFDLFALIICSYSPKSYNDAYYQKYKELIHYSCQYSIKKKGSFLCM